MRDNWYLYYSSCKESSDSHCSEIAPANSAPIDSMSVFTYTGIPVDELWSPAVTPTTENHSGSLTTPSSIAENVHYLAHSSLRPATLIRMLAVPPMGRECSTKAHSRPWRSAMEAVTTHAYTPHAALGNETSLGRFRLERSQVPSEPKDMDIFGQSWSQRGADRHAVEEALTQPAILRDSHHTPQPLPNWPHMTALPEISIPGYADIAGLGNVGPWVADPVPWQAPSPSNRRRHRRRPDTRAEHVICNSCSKLMRRQSLKRHVREVHDHIKRPHPKSSSAAQPGP